MPPPPEAPASALAVTEPAAPAAVNGRPAIALAANGHAPAAVANGEPHAIPPSIAARLANAPMRAQLSGADVRTERLVRQVRGEVEGLKSQLTGLKDASNELMELDLEALAAHPDAAAALPTATLVQALIAAHAATRALEQKNAKLAAKNDALRDRVRALKQERAWFRGRMDTLDEVIAALHANIEDLRHHRDNTRSVAPPSAPRAIRGSGDSAGLPAAHEG